MARTPVIEAHERSLRLRDERAFRDSDNRYKLTISLDWQRAIHRKKHKMTKDAKRQLSFVFFVILCFLW
jgi:hypothetical protein